MLVFERIYLIEGLKPLDHVGVSKNRGGPPKWMVYTGKPLLQWMIWGGNNPYFWFNTHVATKDPFFLPTLDEETFCG